MNSTSQTDTGLAGDTKPTECLWLALPLARCEGQAETLTGLGANFIHRQINENMEKEWFIVSSPIFLQNGC